MEITGNYKTFKQNRNIFHSSKCTVKIMNNFKQNLILLKQTGKNFYFLTLQMEKI